MVLNEVTNTTDLKSKNVMAVTRGRKRKSEEILRAENKYLRNQLRIANDKISSLEQISAIMSEKLSKDAWNFIQTSFNSEIVNLLRNEYDNLGKSNHGRRYSDIIITFCNTVHYYSRKTYKFLRSIFTLPSMTSMWRLTCSLNCEPGLLGEVFSWLNEEVPKKPWLRDCVLIIDGMSIRKNLK